MGMARRGASAWLLLVVLGVADAQEAAPAPSAYLPASEQIPTLGEVRAVAPDEEPPVDLYRFRNPVRVEPNRFERAYQPPPSVKQVSEGGGYLMWGLYQGVAAIARGLHTLTGAPDPIQPAIARPSPLTEAQLERAASICARDSAGCADGLDAH
ncbi:MAG: hypothetical protein QM581_11720 [Pseudomonas sp.]